MGMTVKDLTGQRFGRLVVLSQHPVRSREGLVLWLCQCDCGNQSKVPTGKLNSGNTKSCGCGGVGKIIHNASHSPEYRTWSGIIQRCCNPNDTGYSHYGGRGILICDRWRNSFEAFLTDMGHRPSDSHSIERRNNDGNYEPGNCIWAMPRDQANNRRSSVFHEYKGKRYNEKELANETGIPLTTLRTRLGLGWSLEEQLRDL